MMQTRSNRLRLGFPCLGIAFMLLGSLAWGQVNANVEFSNNSQIDPHPVTYTWNGKKESIIDPVHYYTYYYTGTVNPDARVEKDTKIERIAVTQDEWDANHKWITLKLKYYYQITRNLPQTALSEMSGEAPVQTRTGLPGAMQNMMGGMPGAMGMPGMPGAMGMPGDPNAQMIDPNTGQPMMTPFQYNPAGPAVGMTPTDGSTPEGDAGLGANYGYFNTPTMPDVNMPSFGGMPAPVFDTQAAAEWSFFYDQLVLWQYYCARQILNREEELLEPGGVAPPPPGSAQATAQAQGLPIAAMMGGRGGRGGRGATPQMSMGNPQMQPGMMPGAAGQAAGQSQVSVLDMASAIQPGEAGKQTLEAMKKANSASQVPGMMGTASPYGTPGGVPGAYPGAMGGNPYDPSMAGAGMMGQPMMAATPQGGQAGTAARENFNPALDYTNPDRAVTDYRAKFETAASENEQKLYESFLKMITDIEQREMNQERYEQWLEAKRKDLNNFAGDWRKAENGELFMANDTLFVVTKEPAEALPLNAVNVIKGERITPQDIINDDGSVKKPKVE